MNLNTAKLDVLNFLNQWHIELNRQSWYIEPEKPHSINWNQLISQMKIFKSKIQNISHLVYSENKKVIFCQKGCDHCCKHYPQSIEPLEALTIYGKVRRSQYLIDYLELCSQKVRIFHSNRSNNLAELFDISPEFYFKQNLKCIFLKKSECQIHSIRPLTCQLYLSEAPADYCTPEFLQSEFNGNFILDLPLEIEEIWRKINQPLDSLNLSENLFEVLLELNLLESQWI